MNTKKVFSRIVRSSGAPDINDLWLDDNGELRFFESGSWKKVRTTNPTPVTKPSESTTDPEVTDPIYFPPPPEDYGSEDTEIPKDLEDPQG